jgi:PKD repeat protein
VPSASLRFALRRAGQATTAVALGVTVVAALACAAPALADPPAVTASFAFSPSHPLSYESVQFTDTSVATGDGNAIVSESWDFSQDFVYDRTGPTVSWVFGAPGDRIVHLHVVDTNGDTADFVDTVPVRNRAPNAAIVYAPASPQTGEPITFFSNSTDSDGRITTQVWDLDGDGKYNDGSGTVATAAFAVPGTYTVRLRIADDKGATDSATVSVVVVGQAAGPSPPPISPFATAARIMSPFPIVRISGLVRKHGVRLRLLSVDAPLGARVSVRCRGHGCPFKRRSLKVRAGALAAALPGTRTVRVGRLGHRLLRPGAVVKVFVTKKDLIGKYTRLRVRRGKLPARADRCLEPNTKNPISCPGA